MEPFRAGLGNREERKEGRGAEREGRRRKGKGRGTERRE